MPTIVRLGGGEIGIPDGRTVTPVDDYKTWLKCAGLDDEYGSLSNVIASTYARSTLCNNMNALRYMVRSTSMILPAVLANANWISALDTSIYSITVPALTSNTSSSIGTASESNKVSSGYEAYKAFDGVAFSGTNTSICWWSEANPPQYIQFDYASGYENFVYKVDFGVQIDSSYTNVGSTGYIAASSDGVSFTNIKSFSGLAAGTLHSLICSTFLSNPNYKAIRVYLTADNNSYQTGSMRIRKVQFHGLNLT